MGITLQNRFTDGLIADKNTENIPRKVLGAHYSWVTPQIFPNSSVIHLNDSLLDFLNMTNQKEEVKELVCAKSANPNIKPFSMSYAGHQFGHWAGQLGDGRAINLGNVIAKNQVAYELQLKGAGPTPYSRTADGYAVLRSSIREYMCSEAMFHLGAPTTRALSLAVTNEEVLRDMMYNGNAAYEPGAIVCRVSENFIRFGNFEYLASQQDYTGLVRLIDYSIINYFPEIDIHDPSRTAKMFKSICQKTMEMIVHWMRVGFVHGVMNTDNMSIIGETIDYGPYGWLDNYDGKWTPNTTDLPGRRYCFENQPYIAQWNLVKLANALVVLTPNQVTDFEKAIHEFATEYQVTFESMMKQKLGFNTDKDTDSKLISQLLVIMQVSEVDMTIFFRNLSNVSLESDIQKYITPSCYREHLDENLERWMLDYVQRIKIEQDSNRKEKMNAVNPKYVFRNYMAQMTIEAAYKGDYSFIHEMYELIQNPYNEQPKMDRWFAKRPDWAKEKIGCSMLSCSS